MTPSDFSTLSDLANNVTVIGLFVIFTFLLVTDRLITRSRLQDWQDLAEQRQKRIEEFEKRSTDQILQYERMVSILQGIQTVLSNRKD